MKIFSVNIFSLSANFNKSRIRKYDKESSFYETEIITSKIPVQLPVVVSSYQDKAFSLSQNNSFAFSKIIVVHVLVLFKRYDNVSSSLQE